MRFLDKVGNVEELVAVDGSTGLLTSFVARQIGSSYVISFVFILASSLQDPLTLSAEDSLKF